MTRSELVIDLKKLIGPGVAVDDSGLATWLNGSYMYMVDEITKVNPDFFTTDATAPTLAGEQIYDQPEDCEKIVMVILTQNGTPLRCLALPNINAVPNYLSSDSSQGFNSVQPYYYSFGSQIGFKPIPTDDNGTIRMWYVYTPLEMTSDSDSPAFPKKYHHIIKYGAYADYLDQDDEHAAAETIRNRFERRVAAMVENLADLQIDEPKSIIQTGSPDLYVSDSDHYV